MVPFRPPSLLKWEAKKNLQGVRAAHFPGIVPPEFHGILGVSERVDAIIARMANAIGSHSAHAVLGGTLKFDFGADGSVFIDGNSAPPGVSAGGDRNADCTIAVSLEDFERMAKGELDGTAAFMQGKLRVVGDMGLALKIGPILEKARG
jgi:putative sterol carrier protein